MYAWKITKDHIDGGSSLDTVGPRGALTDHVAKLELGEGEAFKLYDDDGELYCEDLIIGDHSGFEPLDDFGMPNAGCTEIHYRNRSTNVWETL